MNGYSELRLQVANDQIRRLHADAASQRLARRAPIQDPDAAAPHSIGAMFSRSLPSSDWRTDRTRRERPNRSVANTKANV